MAIAEEFREAIENDNTLRIRIMLKNSLIVDPTFREFKEMLSFAENNISNLYDEHDGEVLKYETFQWNKEYMDKQMVELIDNFSKERINLLKNICKHLYAKRANAIIEERNTINITSTQITKKQVGTSLAIGGVVAAAVGVVAAKPIILATGVVAGVTGGVLLITDKK